MIFALELRRAASLVVATLGLSSLSACFDVNDAPPLASEGSSTGTPAPDTSTTDEPGVTSVDPDTSTTSADPDPSTTSVDPDPSTTSVDPDTSGSSSSGAPPDPVCGDGVFDPATEACDDGNLDAGDLCNELCQVETVVFTFTGGVQQLEVPAWVDAFAVEAWGAEGGDALCCEGPDDDGGLGGYVSGVLPEVGGATLQIYVGGQGATGQPAVPALGGFNGGGTGGEWGAGGGGATDVRFAPGTLDDRLLAAAGGGGGNCGCPNTGTGGGGGGLSGQAGIGNLGEYIPGGGGTQAAGGSAGTNGSAGSLGQGGSSASADLYHFSGGGGGYYGGGGGYAAGAGGGSSYLGALENGLTMPAIREGNGEVHLTPIAAQ